MRAKDPERRSLALEMDRMVRCVVALVVLVMCTGVAGGVVSHHLLRATMARERPAAASNDALMRDLLVAQSGLRGFIATGREEFLVDNVSDRAAIQADQDAVARLSDTGLDGLRGRQDEAIDAWWAFRDRAVALRRAGGDASALLPHTPFDAIQTSNKALGQALDGRVQRSTRLTSAVLVATAVLNAVEAGALVLLLMSHRRRLREDVLCPLQSLRDTVNGDDPGRRAARDRGPSEIRDLATVVNRYLDQVEHSERENEAAVRRLEALDRQKTDFMATVSHELRTPLTSIAGYLEMLQDGDYGELDERQSGVVSVLERNTGRLRAMIEELLVLGRIESNGVEVSLQPVDLGGIAGVVVENLRPQADRGRVMLTLDAGRLPAVCGDAGQLERAMTNIVGNAVKFTPVGGQVHVAVAAEGGEQVVRVADTGIGIPAADLESVGRRFFRAGNVTDQSIPGTGLGLSIVTAIMASHGGSCDVQSEVGKGTTVTLRLPGRRPSPADGAAGNASDGPVCGGC